MTALFLWLLAKREILPREEFSEHYGIFSKVLVFMQRSKGQKIALEIEPK